MDTHLPNDGLDGHLKALRSETEQLNAPPCVEQELMAAFARQHARRRWYQRLPRLALPGGAVALAALAVAVLVKAPSGGPPLLQRGDGGVFIALDSLERIEGEPDTRMIAAEVPRMELASLGVPVTPENAGDSVLAEMLVSADGEPLALRLTSAE
ncbi:hypothetical protein [Massilia soli]|uniref:Uncharacterized protein n=1 Tax=Massilia soli TaxID=2792854 RepID=A0ABS7SHR3_9BURK|nr:hypothetical protein [Massilia soli]MBZ2205749.1 hypothetical protein [Massilia soli]